MEELKGLLNYNVSSTQLKFVFKYLKWSTDNSFRIENPDEKKINSAFNQYMWIEILDKTHKVVFSKNAIEPIIEAINQPENHLSIFDKALQPKSKKKTK